MNISERSVPLGSGISKRAHQPELVKRLTPAHSEPPFNPMTLLREDLAVVQAYEVADAIRVVMPRIIWVREVIQHRVQAKVV